MEAPRSHGVLLDGPDVVLLSRMAVWYKTNPKVQTPDMRNSIRSDTSLGSSPRKRSLIHPEKLAAKPIWDE